MSDIISQLAEKDSEIERLTRLVDLVETNARVQAKLLADTARERDELRAQVERQRSGLSEARSDFLACAEVFDELDNPKGYNLAVGAAGQIEVLFSSDGSK